MVAELIVPRLQRAGPGDGGVETKDGGVPDDAPLVEQGADGPRRRSLRDGDVDRLPARLTVDLAHEPHAAETPGPHPGVIANSDSEIAQLIARRAVAPGDDDAVDGLSRQLAGLVAGRHAAQRLHLVVELAALLEQALDAARELLRLDAKEGSRLLQQLLVLVETLEAGLAGQ